MHFTAPVVAALAAFAATADAKRYICDRQNYASVAKQILNPAYFCMFYLKDDRKYSPLKDFKAEQLTHLCHCFVQNSPHVRGPIKSVPIPKANYNVCNQKHVNALHNQYKHPVDFARFWNKGTNRKYSPMPTIPNVKAVHKAASCVIAQFEANQGGNGGNGGQTTPVTTPVTTPATTPATSARTSSASVTSGTTGTPAAPQTTASSAPAFATTTTAATITTPVVAQPSSTTTSAASSTGPALPNLGCVLLGNCPTTTLSQSTTAITAAPTTTTTASTSSSSSSSSSVI